MLLGDRMLDRMDFESDEMELVILSNKEMLWADAIIFNGNIAKMAVTVN